MNPESGGSWIIFGGAFDPVHRGHLQIAADMLKSQKSEGVMFVPSFIPPHKIQGCFASFDDRMQMLKIATCEIENSFVSPIESERHDENFTINTVRALKERYPKCTFSFLIGADNVPLMSSWHKINDLIKEVKFVVGSRPGTNLEKIPELLRNSVTIIETSMVDISASRIRNSISKGIDKSELERLVPTAVATYIIEENLYQ